MEEATRRRVYWHSRRGMLELDLLLLPFVEGAWDGLSAAERRLYEELISHEDSTLHTWLLGGTEPPDSRFTPLIRKIKTLSTPNLRANNTFIGASSIGDTPIDDTSINDTSTHDPPINGFPADNLKFAFDIAFSWWECVVRGACYALAIPAPWFSAVPWWAAALLSVLLTALAWQDSRSLRPATRLRRLVLRPDGALLHSRQRTIKTSPPRVLLLWEAIILLRFQEPESRRRHHIAVWPDSLPNTPQRHLRRHLRQKPPTPETPLQP